MTARTQALAQPRPAPRSWTAVHFLPGDFAAASLKNLAPAQFPEGAFSVEDSSRPAVLASADTEALFPFDQLLLSADVSFPGGGSLEAEAQVKTAAGWSPWFSYGRFSPDQGSASAPGQDNEFGRMDVDILRLKQKATAYRYRLTLTSRGARPPVLRLAAASYTDSAAPYDQAGSSAKPADFKPLKTQVAPCSQMALQVNYSGDICSPVSMSMAFGYLGRKADPLATAAAVLDSGENIYGNWFLNTSYAGSTGLYAFLTRLNSLEEARALLNAGAAVVVSVTFGPDELKNSPLKKTKGHLMVITGFDAKGNVIVNDPAAPENSAVGRTYDRTQFAAAWLKNKYGTAYVLAKDFDKLLAVKDRVAEFYSMPPASKEEKGKLIESQLLANERAELLQVSGSWARVRAVEQRSLAADGKTLAPYEGWLPLETLGFSLPLPPTAVVNAKTVKTGGGDVSLGVKVRVLGPAKAGVMVALGDGIPAVLPADALNPLPQPGAPDTLRRKILQTARVFLGDKYYWGGRSAWGVDCSGLVSLAFRAWGLDLPRNAGDQYLASRRVPREELKPADLIFSADAAKPGFINHVMLYSGAGKLIEATGDTNSVREVTFKEKFGADLAKVKHGALVNGKKIFFGRILK
jgi:cell wall-associated NlpC family hydrolase